MQSREQNVADVHWIDFQDVQDSRGHLTAIEGAQHVPFAIKRIFYVHRVTPGLDRGGHAHRETDQILAAVHGSLKVDIGDGEEMRTFELEDPSRGIYVPRMLFTRLYDFQDEAVLLVLSSTHYDMSKSIRNWPDYLTARGKPFRPAPWTSHHSE